VLKNYVPFILNIEAQTEKLFQGVYNVKNLFCVVNMVENVHFGPYLQGLYIVPLESRTQSLNKWQISSKFQSFGQNFLGFCRKTSKSIRFCLKTLIFRWFSWVLCFGLTKFCEHPWNFPPFLAFRDLRWDFLAQSIWILKKSVNF
jgi:hypothetical protein